MSSTDFCRCARRIRWVHRDDPQRRSHALQRLSRAFDARRSFADTASTVDVSSAARTFAQRVADEIDSGTLLYSRRLRLLKEARRRGIRRFDANLIIAAVQDRAPASVQVSSSTSSRHAWLGEIAFALMIQSAIVVLLWQALV